MLIVNFISWLYITRIIFFLNHFYDINIFLGSFEGTFLWHTSYSLWSMVKKNFKKQVRNIRDNSSLSDKSKGTVAITLLAFCSCKLCLPGVEILCVLTLGGWTFSSSSEHTPHAVFDPSPVFANHFIWKTQSSIPTSWSHHITWSSGTMTTSAISSAIHRSNQWTITILMLWGCARELSEKLMNLWFWSSVLARCLHELCIVSHVCQGFSQEQPSTY